VLAKERRQRAAQEGGSLPEALRQKLVAQVGWAAMGGRGDVQPAGRVVCGTCSGNCVVVLCGLGLSAYETYQPARRAAAPQQHQTKQAGRQSVPGSHTNNCLCTLTQLRYHCRGVPVLQAPVLPSGTHTLYWDSKSGGERRQGGQCCLVACSCCC
jgi:hypothetical protein